MNPDSPLTPRQGLEMRITALLLGELPADKADALRAQIAADPELTALHTRLRRAIALLHEARTIPAETGEHAPAQLSPERREKLLAHFKTTPVPARPPRRDWKWVAPLGLAATLVLLIGGALLGSKRSRSLESGSDFSAAREVQAVARSVEEPRLGVFETAPTASSALREREASRAQLSSPPLASWETPIALSTPLPNQLADMRPPPAPSKAIGNISAAKPSSGFTEGWSMGGTASASRPAPPPNSMFAEPNTIQTLGSLVPEGANNYTGSTTLAGNSTIAIGGTVNGDFPAPAIPQDAVSYADSALAFQVPPPQTSSLGLVPADKSNFSARTKQDLAGTGSLQLNSGALSLQGQIVPPGASVPTTAGKIGQSPVTVGRPVLPNESGAFTGTGSLSPPPTNETSAYYNQTIGPKFRGEVEEVQKLHTEAEGFEETSRSDLAMKRTDQILNDDKYNIAARERQEDINHKRPQYADAAYNETRSRMLWQVQSAWQSPVRRFNAPESTTIDNNTDAAGTARINAKLQKIIIPKLELREATIVEALEFLKKKSTELDNDPDNARRGVSFALKLESGSGGATPVAPAPAAPAIPGLEAIPGPAATPAAVPIPAAPGVAGVSPTDARISVALTNIPLVEAVKYVTSLANLKYKVEPYAVSIVPMGDSTAELIQKEYKVPPSVISRIVGSDGATGAGKQIAGRVDAVEFLKSAGVTFPEGATSLCIPPSGRLLVRNTQENLDLIDQIIAAISTSGPAPAAEPQPEIATSENPFSTFSLNVTDVSFKLAAASLEKGQMPNVATVRSEEFINAFDYRDPEPAAGTALTCTTERARYPFAQNRDLLRCSVKTAAAGRAPGRPLNVVLLLDNSGSMERADRVRIVQEALRVLVAQLQPQDRLSIVTFARTPHLWIDGVAGDKAAAAVARVSEITPEGGTNLEAALYLGYSTARRHFQEGSINRVVLLTDGAANLGDVNPDTLKQWVETERKRGIALDAFGIGWEGYDDSMLETLSRNGDGRYGFINTPEAAATEFAGQLAGALRVAAADVKVQVEFNPRRVTAYRQIGYAKHQLTKEQFRDNTVDAAELGAAESGNALYVVEVNPRGDGDLGTVRVRFKVPGTTDYREHAWPVPFNGPAQPLDHASPALRLAGTASAFSEMLAGSQFATEVTSDALLRLLNGVPGTFGADPRPRKLEWMIRQAKSLSGR